MKLGVSRGVGSLAALLLLLASAGSAHAQRLQCDRCHGELELLRQRVSTLAAAERLLAPAAVLRRSAHASLQCAECHSGTGQYPHRSDVVTRSCASCHAAADTAWQRGVHAHVQDREVVGCSACHGVHDVASKAQLATAEGIGAANARCSACHQSQALPHDDAHTDRVLCASCHAPHDVQQPRRLTSTLHPTRQLETCGGCHDSIAARWANDVHADTLRALLAGSEATHADAEALPGCTACHGAHGIQAVESGSMALAAVGRCAECHEHYAHSYYESYHGQAVRLGSQAAAACSDCHGAHGIRPSSEPAARTAEANLVSTCSACHPQARASFVAYDSHPEPMNRAKNPWTFFAFWSMNALLVGAMGMWALHTGLWWVRLLRNRRKARQASV